MTCAKYATADTGYHAVVAMCFDDFTIVIDHALHLAASKVPLGGVFDMAPYIPLFGELGRERFRYFLEKGKYKLTMDKEKASYDPLYFSEMDINKATNQLAIPAAEEQQPVKGQEHILVPPRKYLSVRSLLNKEPRLIAAERVKDKWLATTVRIQVHFAEPAVSMQIPNRDWLVKPQGKNWYKRLKNYRLNHGDSPQGLQTRMTDATVLLTLPLNARTYEQLYAELAGLVIMQALGEEFGLSYEVLNKMMWSVNQVWAPYRYKRADSIIEGEMSQAEVADAETSDR